MNEITQEVIEEFKLRIKLDGNEEDENLRRILVASIADLIMKTGQYTIEDSGVFRELVFERARYVYNDALEYFDTNFVAQITALAIGNTTNFDGGGPLPGGGITLEDITNALGYVPANNNDLTSFINRYNAEITQTNTLAMGNQNRINALDNRVTSENTALSNRVRVNETSIISLTNGVQANANRIDALENAPQTESYDDTEVRTLISNNTNNISTITNTTIPTLDNRIEVLEQRPSGSDYDDTEVRGLIQSNTDRIVTLENRPSGESYDDTEIRGLINNHVQNTDIHKTSSVIRQETTTPIGLEVVNSLPTSNLYEGRVVFNKADNTFRGYNGGEWL